MSDTPSTLPGGAGPADRSTAAGRLPLEQLRMHAANLPLAVGGSAVGAAALGGLLAVRTPLATLAWAWLAGMAALLAGLAVLGIAHRRARPGAAAAPRWLHWFRCSVLIHGMAWGLAGLVLFADQDVVHQSFLLLVLSGVAASGASMVALDFAAALLFIVPVLAPIGLRAAAEGDALQLGMGLLAWAYLLFLALNSRLAWQRQLEVVRLRDVDAERVRALRHGEELLQRTGELARVGGWELEREHQVLHLTTQAGRVLGLAPGAGHTFAAMCQRFSPPARAALEQAVQRAFADGEPFALELAGPGKDGHARWVSCIGFPDLEDGHAMRLRGALQDISDRKGAELQLQETLHQMQAIVDTAMEGIVTFDAGGRVITFNRAAEQLFGCTAADVVGRDFGLLVPGLHDAGAGELEGVRADGSRFPLELALSRVNRADQAVMHVALVRDIAQRRATEAALRTAKEAAESASRAKSAFLANMSHEIRTPMHGMLGMVELLSRMPMTAEQQHYIRTMRRSGQSLMALLNDILDLSKIESGKLDLEQRPFDLRRTLAACIELMGPTASQKGLRLLTNFSDDLPQQAVGDALRLQQVLNNILGNAIKFTTQGEVIVTAVPAPSLGPAGLQVCVADTGPGIDAAKVEAIFSAFVQGDSSTARQHGGTGLGLAIARRIVQAMGGSMTVDTVPDRGSRFCFTARLLSCRPGDAVAEAGEAGAAVGGPAPGPGPGHGPALHVLVAEDNPVNQMYAQAVLRQLGHEVDLADDGVQAVEKMRQNPGYDLILMDCHMPHMDGFEATRQIRALERGEGRDRPRYIVALTASAMAEDRQRCLDCGMDDLLSKPFSVDEMREVVDVRGNAGRLGGGPPRR